MKYKDFIVCKLNKASFSNRKKIYDVGINDADYKTVIRIDGEKFTCPIYAKWTKMFYRCYSENTLLRQPTYIGCTVDERWHSFMAFREWVLAQPEWEGLHLDKDLLVPGNMIYGPDTCLFVSLEVNNFLTFNHSSNSGLPIGVVRSNKKYLAQGRCLNGKQWRSRVLDTQEEASALYWKTKLDLAHRLASMQSDLRVAKAIVNHIKSCIPSVDLLGVLNVSSSSEF